MPTKRATVDAAAPTESSRVDDVAVMFYQNVSLMLFRMRRATSEKEVLSESEMTAMGELLRRGPLTIAALARFERISPQSMGATIKSLGARGLIVRTPDAEDGRRINISLSDAGREALKFRHDARIRRFIEAFERSTFSAREIERLQAIRPLLERVAANMGHGDPR